MKNVSFFLLCIMLSSCCKMPNFVGKTLVFPNNWRSELTFLSDSTVSFSREYGWGVPMQKGFAKWEVIDNKHIKLTSDYTHQNIPIDVVETKSPIDSLQFILMNKLSYNTTIWLCSGNEKYEFDGDQLAISKKDIPNFQSFYLVAESNPEKHAPLLNNDQVRTAIYSVKNTDNNQFKIALSSSDNPWIMAFYYQELNCVLKIKKCKEHLKWKNPPLWNWDMERD